MATQTRGERAARSEDPKDTASLSRDQLVAAYRTMLLSRRLDDKEIQLKRQNKIFFQISGAGHEAVLTAAGDGPPAGLRLVLPLLPRPRALPAARRDGRRRCSTKRSARRIDPALRRPADAEPLGAQGRSTSSPSSSPTGTQFLQAVGCAEASLRAAQTRRRPRASHGDEVVYVSHRATAPPAKASSGSRSTRRAISSCRSSTWSKTTATRSRCRSRSTRRAASISKLVRSFPGLFIQEVDGCDLAGELTARCRRRVDYARERQGTGARARAGDPAVLALAVGRRSACTGRRRSAMPTPRAIRSRLSRSGWSREGHATEAELAEIQDEVDAEVLAAHRRCARAAAAGGRHDAIDRLLARRRSDGRAVRHRGRSAVRGRADHDGRSAQRVPADEMRRDPKILLFGEDVADVSREAYLGEVKGKGGVFKVTWGLQKEFGAHARLQLAAGRSEHRRPRDRAGDARLQAGGRDPVLRLHLAGVHAAARRARDDALAVEQRLLVRRSWCA